MRARNVGSPVFETYGGPRADHEGHLDDLAKAYPAGPPKDVRETVQERRRQHFSGLGAAPTSSAALCLEA